MNKIKKLLGVFLIITFSLILISCGKINQANNPNNKNEGNEKTVEEAQKISGVKIHYIDVGQGDSELIQIGDKNVLIDAGTSDKKALDYLKSIKITKLDYVIATHPHEDHIGSMDDVIKACDVGTFYAPKVTQTTKTYEDMIKALKDKNLKITVPKAGDTLTIGDAELTFLAPNSYKYDDINNYSIVCRLKYGNTSFLFMGDAQDVSESEILQKQLDIKSDVLKVGHHGSHSSTTQAFLDKVNPKYAVISCGKDNDYGHPHKETVTKLNAKDINVFRTDLEGTIIASSDGINITFNTNPVEKSANVSGTESKKSDKK